MAVWFLFCCSVDADRSGTVERSHKNELFQKIRHQSRVSCNCTIVGIGHLNESTVQCFDQSVSYMELLTPSCYSVLYGTLSQGIFSKRDSKIQDGSFGVTHNTYDVDFSGRNVAVLLNFFQEKGFHKETTITGLDSASIRSSQCADIDIHNHWGRISLAKLKADKGITLVDSKPRVVLTVSDLRYQERLDSFFDTSSPNQVVQPVFSETDRFDPKILAAHGWEYSPPEYDSEQEIQSSWRYFVARQFGRSNASLISMRCTAEDAIKSYGQYGCYVLCDFHECDKFPDKLFSGKTFETDVVSLLVKGLKEIYSSSLLSINKQPCEAVVVKLAGYHDYLLTTLEYENEMNFKPFPDDDLFVYFRDSWQEHIQQIDTREFVRNTLPILGKILPALDKNYKMLIDCIEMISGMSHAMLEIFEASNISQEIILARMTELKEMYHELVLIKKQIEFYKVVKKNTQRNIDGVDEGAWIKCLTLSRRMEVNNLGITLNSEDLDAGFKEWFVKFNRDENEKSIFRLNELERKLFIIQFKVNVQSVLEQLLSSLAGKLIAIKYSSVDESLKNECHQLFAFTNEVLALINFNRPSFDEFSKYNLEPLDLAFSSLLDMVPVKRINPGQMG